MYNAEATGKVITRVSGAVVSLHWAVEVPPLTGIVAGIAGDHPVNVYPVFNGGVGVVIDVPKFCVTDAGEAGVVAPLPANVYVYEIGVYVAVIPVFPTGITAVHVAATPAPPPALTQPFTVPVDESATVYPATEVADIESEVP